MQRSDLVEIINTFGHFSNTMAFPSDICGDLGKFFFGGGLLIREGFLVQH